MLELAIAKGERSSIKWG